MTKRILAVLLAIVMVLGCMPVSQAQAVEAVPASVGTTYYVSSQSGVVGNDGTSEEAPFASLLEINEITLQPGDRVLLERGSVFVDEYLHVKGSGSPEAPIVIDVYGDENQPKPLIQTNGYGVWHQDFGKTMPSTAHVVVGDVSSCILLYDVEYIEISNIAMTNEGNFAEGEVYNTAHRMDRTGVAGIAQNIGTMDHIVLRDLDIRNVQGNVYNKHMPNGGIYFICNLADDPSTGVARFDDVLIEGCRLDQVNRWGIAVACSAYWNMMPNNQGIDDEECRTYGSTNVVIRNNYLTNVGGDGITPMYCFKPLIEYNVLDDYCLDITPAVYQHPDGRSGMVAAGIWPWQCKTALFQNNECYDSTYNQDGQAWDADSGDNAIYQYNYSCNNAGGAIMFCLGNAVNTVFRYNISQNDLSGVLNLCGSPNGDLYNNVFYIKEGVKINRDNMSGGWGNVISNNIFYYSGSEPASAALGNWGDITAEWSNNIYFNYATTPDDPHAITADPLFVAPGTGPVSAQETGLIHDISAFEGYKLQENSPAINAGIPIANNGGKDFFGNELDLIPDIGAYEAGTFQSDAEKAVVVNLDLGESFTLTDETGDYSDVVPVIGNGKIASVELSVEEGVVQYEASTSAATELKADVPYMLCSNVTGSALTNVISDAASWGTRALRLTTDKTVTAANTWTLEADGTNYKIKSSDGQYLSIALNASSLGETGQSFTPATKNAADVWTFFTGSHYLNNLGSQDFMGGWTAAGNGSTWKVYEIIGKQLDAVTELTFTGLFPGNTTIEIGDTVYLIRVAGTVEDVELKVGETATYTDETGNYTDADVSALDETVATVELEGLQMDAYELGESVAELVSGEQYILVNNRTGKPVTNAPATQGAAHGLSLSGTKEAAAPASIWTITATESGYFVQDLDSKYMTVGSDAAGITDEPAVLNISRNGTNWNISQNGAYLNHFGGSSSTCAAGWKDASAANDAGSMFTLYKVTPITAENGTIITFTGVGAGETYVLIGDIVYNIVVTDEVVHEHEFVNGKCACGEEMDATFTDVPVGSYCFDAVEWAVEKGVTNGVSETLFNPNGKCMRAHVVTFLWRAAGSPEPTATETKFVDVEAGSFYEKAVLWAVEKGITTGVDETHFAPSQNCSRAQVVTFLWRAKGEVKPTTQENPFNDVPAGAYCYDAVLWAVENGITNGVAENTFGPNALCTRAQVVTFLYRAE